jgi:hypothetical protein
MLMPTESDLQAAAVDVSNEIYLFSLACSEINHRAIYQAWYVLARNLMDFFDTLPTDRRYDAVLAGDYFHPPGHWHSIRERRPRPFDYEGYRAAINIRAAHLSYGRAAYRENGNRCDPAPEMATYLLGLASDFLELLPPEMKEWFRATGFELPWAAA